MSFEIPPNFILTPKQKNSSQSFINQSVLSCIPCCILSSKTVQSEEKNCPKFVRKKVKKLQDLESGMQNLKYRRT